MATLTAGLLAWCVLCAPTLAVAQSMARDLAVDPTKVSLSPEDRQSIRHFTSAHLELLATGSAPEMRRARRALQEHPRNRAVSADFQMFYSEVALPGLSELAGQEDRTRAVVALQIIGDLGTPEAVELLEQYLDSDDATLRFATVFGYRSTFLTLENPSSVLRGREIIPMIRTLRARIEAEPNPLVLDMCVRAMMTAIVIGDDAGGTLGDIALEDLTKAVSNRIHTLGPGAGDALVFGPCLKAARDVRVKIFNRAIQAGGLDPDLAKSAGGMCGDLLGYVFRRVRAGALPTADAGADDPVVRDARALEMAAVRLAVGLLRVCKDELGVGSVDGTVPELAPLIRSGTAQGDAQYIRQVMDVIGDGGLLTRRGFDFRSDRFLRDR
ncbi:MAG: hypothetical protein IID31_03900 [Planctomycetes bacterium]|nr:hypothetical protein [Planctomycetota bacterium]